MKAKGAVIVGFVRAIDANGVQSIAAELYKLGMKPDSGLARVLTDLCQLKTNFAAYRRFQSRRQLEKDLVARITQIRSVQTLAVRDEGYFNNPDGDSYLERHLFVALIEKAILVTDDYNRVNPRDMTAFAFHLWKLKGLMEAGGVEKPSEAIAAVLEVTGAISDLGGWNASTIKNKVSVVHKYIEQSKGLGACHEPKYIGSSPKVNSPEFVRNISGGCETCAKAWGALFNVEVPSASYLELAANQMADEFPSLASKIHKVTESLSDMPLDQLVPRIPENLRDIFLSVWDQAQLD